MMVGENGAGKTTLVKLLCRFYDPDSGSIELDGIDIRKFSVKDLRRLITITFQRGLNYHAKVGESIAMGDLASDPSISEIEEAARNAGAHEFITHLPQGYETLLGKVHANGMELSGGQWQRIAMARAYLRKSPIMLLDEPTSFLDSWSEADWFQRLRRLAKGRTALVITHRFTIAMRADIIHVMHDGQIVESGSHDKLVEQDGWYAKSWRLQMQASAMADNKSDELPRIHEYVLQEVTTEM
jgi:ATP-binding cassette subfamily B protein